MKKILIFETFPMSPHFETAIELAIKNVKKGKVFFFGVVMIFHGRIGNCHIIKRFFFFLISIK